MSDPVLLRMTAPLRQDFEVPYHDLGDPATGPTVAFVAGLHGDEVNGTFVLARLASFLRRVVAQPAAGQELCGRVIIVPAVNVIGLNTRSRRWPFDGTDINRMFPGYDAGETTQRIAGAVLQLTRTADYRVDMHSSNLDFEELPQVRLYAPSDTERRSALLFGLPAVIERPMNSVFTATIGHAWREAGGQSFVLQSGFAGQIQTLHCERLFRAVVAFLSRLDLLRGVELSDDEDVHYFGLNRTFPFISSVAGLFVSPVDVGRWVRRGETIGLVYDPFDGELRDEVKTPVTGLLSGIRRAPLLFEGDLLARVQTNEPVTEVADTYLRGRGQ